MASQPEKVQLHRERERVLALSRLFAPDPERPDAIAAVARELPLPDGLAYRLDAACELTDFLGSPFADVRRLAASALGKMAPERPMAAMFVSRLAELARNDMDTPEYNANRQRKHILYQRAAKKLISVSFRDDANLIDVLRAKLSRYIRLEETT